MTRVQWERWLWTCVFALIPLLLWLLLAQLQGVGGIAGAAEASRELLFFALTICTLTLFELRYADATLRSRSWYESLSSASIGAIIASAALYGAFLSLHDQPKVLLRLFAISGSFALLGFVLGTWAQVFIHRGDTDA